MPSDWPGTALRLDHSIAVLTFEGLAAVAPADRIARVQHLLRRAAGRDDIIVGRRPSGRPCLGPPLPELGISVAHSGCSSLIGLSCSRAVGVDLEQETRFERLDVRRLARDHFSPGERAAIASRKDAEAKALFMALWVAKESILKLSGRGIVDGLAMPDLSGHVEALMSAHLTANQPIPIAVADLSLIVIRMVAARRPTVVAALCHAQDQVPIDAVGPEAAASPRLRFEP